MNNKVYTAAQVILAAGLAAHDAGGDVDMAMCAVAAMIDDIAAASDSKVITLPAGTVPADAVDKIATYDPADAYSGLMAIADARHKAMYKRVCGTCMVIRG